MKRILVIIALLFIQTNIIAQIYSNPSPSLYGIRYNRGKIDSTLLIPTGCGTPTDSTFLHDKTMQKQAAKYYDSCGHKEYVWDPSLKVWIAIVTPTTLSGYHTASYYDSVFLGLYAQSGYNKTNWDLAYSWGDWHNSVAPKIDSVRIKNILAWNYQPLLSYTAANAATTISINGTAFDLSTNRSWNVGTVTSIGTGWGFVPNTITTTGTFVLDSFAVASRARLRLEQDSINGIFGTHLSLINSLITDSAYQAGLIAANAAAIATKEPTISTGSTNYFYSWDKTWRQISYSQISATPDLSVYELLSHKGAANGYTPLGSDSKVPTSYLPAAIQNGTTYTVSSQAAMLALSAAQVGDFCRRLDSSLTYVLVSQPYSSASNWQTILSPTAPVLSVAGMVGDVTLTTSNVSEGTNLYYTQTRFDNAFNAKSTSNLSEGTNLYYTDTRARASISSTATGLTYTSASGVFSLTSGYQIPTTTQVNAWNSLVTMTYPGVGIAVSTGSGWATSITDNSSNWNTVVAKMDSARVKNWVSWNFQPLGSYLTSESDPIYTASSWYSTTNNHSNWDAAYSWGNWASSVAPKWDSVTAKNFIAWNYVLLTDSRLSDARVASDVYAWAKASVKPSYVWTEIGSRPTLLSQFTNDLGNYGGFLTSVDTTNINNFFLKVRSLFTAGTNISIANGVITNGITNNNQLTNGAGYLTSSTGVTTFSGGTTGLTPNTATSGAITLGGILASTNGGSGVNNSGTLTWGAGGTLGAAAYANFGTTAGTVTQGNDSRLSNIAYTNVANTFTASQTITSTSYGLLILNNTNATAWGNNIAFQSGGTAFGYFGSIGSLLGNTTLDLAAYSTIGNGFRVYTNGNHQALTVDASQQITFNAYTTAGVLVNNTSGVISSTTTPTFVGTNITGTNTSFNTEWWRYGGGYSSGTVGGILAYNSTTTNFENTGASAILTFLGTAGLYQPLENQRLSTSNSPTFNGLTLNSTLVGKTIQSFIGASNTLGLGSLFAWDNNLAGASERQVLLQLNASNGLDYWYYNGSSWGETGLKFNNDGSINGTSATWSGYTTFNNGAAFASGNTLSFNNTTNSNGANISVPASSGNALSITSSNVAFSGTISNGTYTYTLPSATGTLALTSQLPTSLPTPNALTIGTDLSGTSFNGSAAVTINNTSTLATVTGRGATTSTAITVNNTISAYQFSSTVQTLTDGATITFNAANGSNAVVTLGGNRTLAFSNVVAGTYYTLRVIQDATGSRTLTLPTGSKVSNGGGGAVTLSTAASASDLLTFYYDGTNYWVTYSTNYN